MRITVRLDDALLDRARREAARRGETVSALIERGLELILAGKIERTGRSRIELPVCRAGGGTLPGVDLDRASQVLDVAESRDRIPRR